MPEISFCGSNHLTEQWASSFCASILRQHLVTTKGLETHELQKVLRPYRYRDYDAIIMGQPASLSVSPSAEPGTASRVQIDEITEGSRCSQAAAFTAKINGAYRKSLQARLEKAVPRADDVVTWWSSWWTIVCRRVHNYKNLFLSHKMRNVAGLSHRTQKSSDTAGAQVPYG